MEPENLEFIALLEAAQWRPAEAARRLHVSRATVSQYMSGRIRVGAPILELFKMIVANEQPGALTAAGEAREQALAEWERKVIEDLRWLHKEDREKVIIAMRAIVEALPKRDVVDYKLRTEVRAPGETLQGREVNSKVADAARAGAAGALRAARRVPPESSRSREADVPSVRKRRPGGGGRKGTGGKPGLPGQAQG